MSTLRDRRRATRWRLGFARLTIARLLALFAEWRRRTRSRQALARLGAHDLRDIGLTPGDRWSECMKPFWRG
jgi:uncharacterized protein YjiS (DUF1127 family)